MVTAHVAHLVWVRTPWGARRHVRHSQLWIRTICDIERLDGFRVCAEDDFPACRTCVAIVGQERSEQALVDAGLLVRDPMLDAFFEARNAEILPKMGWEPTRHSSGTDTHAPRPPGLSRM
jgi:hypothetical protein